MEHGKDEQAIELNIVAHQLLSIAGNLLEQFGRQDFAQAHLTIVRTDPMNGLSFGVDLTALAVNQETHAVVEFSFVGQNQSELNNPWLVRMFVGFFHIGQARGFGVEEERFQNSFLPISLVTSLI
jgi:hypothetical protein